MAEAKQANIVPWRAGERLRLVDGAPQPLSEQSDEDLMLMHGEGNEAAFEELLRRHQKSILNYTYRMVRNRQIAEELTQDVFVALVRNAGRYRPTAKFTTYLYTIASNIVSKEWARQRRRPRLFSFSNWWSGSGNEDGFDPLEHVGDERYCAAQDVQNQEISDAILEALRHLPEHQRQAFVLLRFQQLAYQEIAEIVQAPVGTVKSRVVRAEQAMRPFLERFRDRL